MAVSLESLADSVNILSKAVIKQSEQQLAILERLNLLDNSAAEAAENSSDSGPRVARGAPLPAEVTRRDDIGSSAIPNQHIHCDSVPLGGIPVGESPPLCPGTASSFSAAEVEKEYDIIRDSLHKVKLPNTLRVFDSKSGIKRDCQPTLAIVSRCARYTETAVKQLSVIVQYYESHQIPTEQLQPLFTILQAEISYLQGEYAALIVKSQFDANTAAVFKCFEGNSGAFNDRSMQNLQRAAEITSAAASTRGRQNQSANYRGNYRPRGQGRGQGWSSHSQRDIYHQVSSRSVPPRRSGNPNNNQPNQHDQPYSDD